MHGVTVTYISIRVLARFSNSLVHVKYFRSVSWKLPFFVTKARRGDIMQLVQSVWQRKEQNFYLMPRDTL